ncbi:hypothetical protein Q0N12_17635 [Rossellomorea marisflavi]|uniref:hypothetical protein n=1 Tax=Rossellomorea marisflavi TaxID=189381 RepID=UPI003457CD8A
MVRDNMDITALAKEHKRFMEKIDVSPYVLHKGDSHYRRAHFYKLTSKLYGSYLFTPIDTKYDEIKHIFYQFVLLDKYLENELSKVNDYASKDYSASYYDYRSEIKGKLIHHTEFSVLVQDLEEMVRLIDFVEAALEDIKKIYRTHEAKINEIVKNEKFSDRDLEVLQFGVGKVNAIQFRQGATQKTICQVARKILSFLDSKGMNTGEFKGFYEKTKIMSLPESETRIDQSLKKLGNYQENVQLSDDELISKMIRLYEKDFYTALDEDFIKRRVRNPSVQEANYD